MRDAAARSVLAREPASVPKPRDGIVEAIRVLRHTRASAIKARTQAALLLRNIVIAAPEELREPLTALTTKQLVEALRALQATAPPRRHRRHPQGAALARAALAAARRAGARARRRPQPPHRLAAPRLLAEPGVGPETAAKLLIVAGDDRDRLRSDAALAAPLRRLARRSFKRNDPPLPPQPRRRRQGNCALWTIAINRMLHHRETRAYVNRRTLDGRSEREIRRCLMRHVTRRLLPLLITDLSDARTLELT